MGASGVGATGAVATDCGALQGPAGDLSETPQFSVRESL